MPLLLAAAPLLPDESGLAAIQGAFNPDHLARLLVGLALLMTGPGQYSLDRRIYGPKRIELRR
jgi:uncharacterized membrane protein YphA (DoxX/SURF4 family)